MSCVAARMLGSVAARVIPPWHGPAPTCAATPAGGDSWYCTAATGHDGPHAAYGGPQPRPYVVWADGGKPMSARDWGGDTS